MNRVARVLRHIQQARLPTDPATAAADAHDDFIPALEDIPRTLPPPETDGVVSEDAKAALAAQCTALRERMAGYASHELLSDVGALVKSVEWAVCFGEWYAEGDDEKAKQVLAEAERRLADIDRGDWGRTSGAVVRGYRSDIDGSDQPYGLEVPDEAPPERGYPLFVWLHGRGNTATDMHFIHERMSATANAASGGRARPTPAGALVLHPFGRHCVGWKWAGEIDVLDAVAHVQANYNVDPDRIVLAGFSMGGAGAWHIGAHYPVPWCGLHTGAGFVETKRYNSPFPGPPSPTSAGPGGKPYPAGLASVPWYEKVLWGLYDVPNYTRSLLNRPLIVYSGQMDAQMQAALVMQEAFEAVDANMPHLIGEGMGHAYHPDVAIEVGRRIDHMMANGLTRLPTHSSVQTRTLRYNNAPRLQVLSLAEHWEDTRLDASFGQAVATVVASPNVLAFAVEGGASTTSFVVNGLPISSSSSGSDSLTFFARASAGAPFACVTAAPHCEVIEGALRKVPGLQGPMDDAFMAPFLVVMPDSNDATSIVDHWVQSEMYHLLNRWAGLFRGQARCKAASEVTAQNMLDYNLILWGTPQSNPLVADFMRTPGLPMVWETGSTGTSKLIMGAQTFSSGGAVPQIIFPSRFGPGRYVLLNSGTTFREGHDSTNSMQNPKLPDWAVIDAFGSPPDAIQPGTVLGAGFMDEQWRYKK